MGTQLPSPKGAQPPPSVRYSQTAGWSKMPLVVEVGLSPGDFVFDGDSAAPEKKGTAPSQFLAHFSCGQTAGSIKMPLGMEVNLSPGTLC